MDGQVLGLVIAGGVLLAASVVVALFYGAGAMADVELEERRRRAALSRDSMHRRGW